MPAPSPFDRFRHIDPEKAIDKLDLTALQACIDAGWNPERKSRQANFPSSYPLVDRVIFRGWGEGWRLLRTRWPHLMLEPALILRAFQRLQHVVLSDLFEQDAIDMVRPLVAGKKADVLAMEGLYMSAPRYAEESIGDEFAVHFLEERSIQTFEMLKAKGMDLYAPLPGTFHPLDDRLAGHSAWSLALYQMRWSLAYRLRPTQLDDVLRQPKLHLSLSQLMEEAFSPHQDARRMAQTMYAWWLDHFGEWWLQQPGVLPPYERPQWSFLLALSPTARRHVWEAWSRRGEDGVTLLHLVALDAGYREVSSVMEQLLADQGEPAAWTSPGPDGVRPCDLWALTLGQTPETPWTLAEAIIQTRRWGEGAPTCAPVMLVPET